MDKKTKKKAVVKRKNDEPTENENKKKIMVRKAESEKEKVEVVNQVVEVPVEQGQQIVHAGQIVEGNFEQPVFVNMKGEPVQLGPNTVILYEQSGNPSNFAFGGMWTMDSSGRIVMAETIYDVKGEPEEEGANFVQNNTEVATQQVTEEPQNTYQQYEITSTPQVEGQQEYEVAIIENPSGEPERVEVNQVITTEEQLTGLGANAVRWLNQKYDIVVRKLQLNFDAGVKLLHSASGCIQCVYLTTPSMQLAFNSVPQFLCIETGIEFNSVIPTVGGNGTQPSIKHNVTLFLAEDGNGKSVIVSAGISTLIGEELTWLLDTFKSCNPAWRQVRCVVCDPTKCQTVVRTAFPAAHVTCSVWQAARGCARLAAEAARREDALLAHDDVASRAKNYALALLKGEHGVQHLQVLKRAIIGTGAGTLRLWEILTRPGGAVIKLDAWLEPDNYTNILHKGLERMIAKFYPSLRAMMQPEEFIPLLFNVVNQLEDERRNFAITRLRDTETLKQSPTDTITQYAYNLMSHQTKLAQKCLDDRAGRRHSSAAICKYGTSTQECSCLFSKVFRLPCRHILMLTTELKVKTHIPFEPRWTVQHCLFGCDNSTPTSGNNAGAGGAYMEQVVVEADNQHRQMQQQPQIHQVSGGGVRQQQYVLATPGQTTTPVSQVKTHIPFEPRWTVQHCLFGCDNSTPTSGNNAGAGGAYMEQVVVEADNQHRQMQQQPQIHQVSGGGVRQQQYVLATPGQTTTPVSQVIFCGGGVNTGHAVSGAPVITSVLPAGGAVLTPHHAIHH